LVEQRADLLDVHPRTATKVHQDSGVDAAAAGTHDQTLERGAMADLPAPLSADAI
jgi:hypothetical protein